MFNNIKKLLSHESSESWCLSFLFNVIVILFLTIFIYKEELVVSHIILESSIDTDSNVLYENYDISIVPNLVSDNTSFNSNQTVELSEPSYEIDVDIKVPALSIEEFDFGKIKAEDLSYKLSSISKNKGRGTSNEQSIGEALDKITFEIISNSDNQNLVVVWLFDASISLNNQRKEVYNRFNKILTELDSSIHNHDINHVICSFGEKIQYITESPTNNIDDLKNNISEISIDETGTENTFAAIDGVCKKYSSNTSRLMVIIFTDEIGDDYHLVDSVAAFARRKSSSIYVVGSPAPFGKSVAQFRFIEFDARYALAEKWVEIQQGPETLYDLTLSINSLPIDEETLDSGFGPFALSKLCNDTGGLFFSVHPDRDNQTNQKNNTTPLYSHISYFFDKSIMSQYPPDYRSILLQNRDDLHPVKQSLIKACQIPLNIKQEQIMEFKAFTEGMFVEQLGIAQRYSAKFEPKVNEIYNILVSAEKQAKTLIDKRWIASYYLAIGRILITKCRLECYNLILAEAKMGLKKQNPKTNYWTLQRAKIFTTNSSEIKKNYDKAHQYLQYIIDNFPNTPWSLIATQELSTPVSYVWQESYKEIEQNNNNINNNNNNNNNPDNDTRKPKLIPKPQRKVDKI